LSEYVNYLLENNPFPFCDYVISMEIAVNNYFYHHGQYTDERNTVQKKKNDLLLQIIRVLNKCED